MVNLSHFGVLPTICPFCNRPQPRVFKGWNVHNLGARQSCLWFDVGLSRIL